MSVEDSEELPEGWTWAKLGELGAWAGGGTPTTSVASYWDGGTIPWISAKDMKADYLGTSQDFITEAGREAARLTLLPSGSVLMVVRGMILARTFPVAVTTAPATINQDLRALVPSSAVEPSFLLRALQVISGDVVQATGEATHGTRRLEGDKLKSWPIPIPPLAEQRRIVAAVERVLERVESAREKLERVPSTMKRFRQAVLAAACSGRLTADWRGEDDSSAELPNGWVNRRLDSLFTIRTGGTPDRKRPEYYADGTIPWVKTTEVQNCDIFDTEEKITHLGLENSSAKVFPASTLLVALYGEGKTRGQIARLKIAAATNQACSALVNPELSESTNRYVFYCLMSDYHRLRGESAGGNQPNLSNGLIKAWEIPYPPLAEQEVIVRRVAEFFVLADAIEQRASSALRRVRVLTQAVLAKAFRGELVPTEAELALNEGRSYEPASELLARLKASVNGEARRSRGKRTSKRASASGDGLLEFMEG